MIGMKIGSIGKENFFDSESVIKAISADDRAVLSKFGAYVRQSAKSSIRPAIILNKKEVRAAKKAGAKVRIDYKPSAPGEPPRSRRGELRKFILFGYEPEERNVVIGPTLVGGRESETPARLEYGGSFTIKKTGRRVTVAKRPFMQPAYEKEMSRMPAMFAGSLFGR